MNRETKNELARLIDSAAAVNPVATEEFMLGLTYLAACKEPGKVAETYISMRRIGIHMEAGDEAADRLRGLTMLESVFG